MNKQNNKSVSFQSSGIVCELLKNNEFKIKFDNGNYVTAYIASGFRVKGVKRRIKLVLGEKVLVNIFVNDLSRGQIISLA